MNHKLVSILFALTIACVAYAQQREDLSAELEVAAEAQLSVADGRTPLWLNANKYGLSSLDDVNGYLRVSALRPAVNDSLRKWRWGYGVDLAVAGGYTSVFVVQQAYAELGVHHGLLTVGSKELPLVLKNDSLSSGSQTLGKNARPIPQVRIALEDYWDVPGLHHWLSIKGHIAYGWYTDGHWQRDFTEGTTNQYVTGVAYHSKAAYFRVGESDELRHFSLEFGAEMACQFGGKLHQRRSDGTETVTKLKGGFSSYVHALLFGGQDDRDGLYGNQEGNQLGSWLLRLNYVSDNLCASLYADHYFEDFSQMFFLTYDGYGQGDNWQVKEDNVYYRFPLKDFMVGAEVNLKKFPYLNNIVVEYLNTKYQSGPYNHDRTANISDHLDGVDNYYNHSLYGSYEHWGQVLGNPLYLSPIYNDDGRISVLNNRFKAIHLGLGGAPVRGLTYRVLATWEAGWGTYDDPYTHRQNNFSMLFEGTYSFLRTWMARCSIGFDKGEIMGNNFGVQITLRKVLWHGHTHKHTQKR